MAKTKISEFDLTPANNTDIDGINIAEGCAPSGINNAIRELMSQLKAQQDGSSGDSFTVSGTLAVTGNLTLDGSAGTSGQVLTSAGSGSTPTWTTQFVTGMIMMWSGSVASIPSGWALCDGSNGTPDLRNRFVVGAGSTYAVNATGGSADAIVVSHTHTGTTSTASLTGSATYVAETWNVSGTATGIFSKATGFPGNNTPADADTSNSGQLNIDASHNHTFTTASSGSSGTNANLPPYYALCYIQKL